MSRKQICALVFNGVQGLGFQTGKKILQTMPAAQTFLTSQQGAGGGECVLSTQLPKKDLDRTTIVPHFDISDDDNVWELEEEIKRKGGLNILAIHTRTMDNLTSANLSQQATEILNIIYWDTRNKLRAFSPLIRHESRIVIFTSRLPPVNEEINKEHEELVKKAQERFDKAPTIYHVDGLINQFARAINSDRCLQEGWPPLPLTVARMAKNTCIR